MEKEFEAIKELYNELEYVYDEKIKSKNKHWEENYKHYHNVRKCLGIIQQALTELKAIKEAKPSEALEILLKAKQERLNFYGRLLDNDEKFFETLEQSLIKAQELEKVLEIVFKKKVSISYLKSCIFDTNIEMFKDGLEEYNFLAPKEDELTQEEFELLKRWCEKCQK